MKAKKVLNFKINNKINNRINNNLNINKIKKHYINENIQIKT